VYIQCSVELTASEFRDDICTEKTNFSENAACVHVQCSMCGHHFRESIVGLCKFNCKLTLTV